MNALILVVVIFISYGSGLIAGHNLQAKKEVAALKAQEEKYGQLEDTYHASSAELERVLALRTARQTGLGKTVIKILDRPSYRVVCLDDDGVRAANTALLDSANPSEPDAKMPATPTP